MARSKLDLLIKEVNHYLGFPYARNVWKDNVLIKEAVFGGKGTWLDLEYATTCAANLENISLSTLSPQQIYNLRKRHHIGIDCSGLTYHLADYWDRLNGGGGILFKVFSSNANLGKYGVRSLSARELCRPHNASPVSKLSDIRPGDFILLDSGKHIVFIVQASVTKIIYVNSSSRTATRPVHLSQILINDPQSSLEEQLWSDLTLTNQPYPSIYHPESGDGVFRLNCF